MSREKKERCNKGKEYPKCVHAFCMNDWWDELLEVGDYYKPEPPVNKCDCTMGYLYVGIPNAKVVPCPKCKPPVGEWEVKLDMLIDLYLSKERKPSIELLINHIKDFIRKLIKPKPSWREVEREFKRKYTNLKMTWETKDTRSEYYCCNEILNHFKQYLTEGE